MSESLDRREFMGVAAAGITTRLTEHWQNVSDKTHWFVGHLGGLHGHREADSMTAQSDGEGALARFERAYDAIGPNTEDTG